MLLSYRGSALILDPFIVNYEICLSIFMIRKDYLGEDMMA